MSRSQSARKVGGYSGSRRGEDMEPPDVEPEEGIAPGALEDHLAALPTVRAYLHVRFETTGRQATVQVDGPTRFVRSVVEHAADAIVDEVER